MRRRGQGCPSCHDTFPVPPLPVQVVIAHALPLYSPLPYFYSPPPHSGLRGPDFLQGLMGEGVYATTIFWFGESAPNDSKGRNVL